MLAALAANISGGNDMNMCPECGKGYIEGDRFCGLCGINLHRIAIMDSGARTQKSLDLIDVYYNLGLVYFKKGEYAAALKVWEKALARDPGNAMIEERLLEVRALI